MFVFNTFSIFSNEASRLSVLSLETNLDKVNSSNSTHELTTAKSLTLRLFNFSFNKYLIIAEGSKRTIPCSGKSKMTDSEKWSNIIKILIFK